MSVSAFCSISATRRRDASVREQRRGWASACEQSLALAVDVAQRLADAGGVGVGVGLRLRLASSAAMLVRARELPISGPAFHTKREKTMTEASVP